MGRPTDRSSSCCTASSSTRTPGTWSRRGSPPPATTSSRSTGAATATPSGSAAGGYYHFADYAADLAFVLRALGGRAVLVGHSMGATSAMQLRGHSSPSACRRSCWSTPSGRPTWTTRPSPQRFAVLDPRPRAPGRRAIAATFSLDEAAARLAERFPRFSPAVARHMAEHGTRPAAGGREWKFDPLHQTHRSAFPSRAPARALFWSRVACPVLYIEGADSPLRLQPDDKAERLALLRARRITMDGVGAPSAPGAARAVHAPRARLPGRAAMRGLMMDWPLTVALPGRARRAALPAQGDRHPHPRAASIAPPTASCFVASAASRTSSPRSACGPAIASARSPGTPSGTWSCTSPSRRSGAVLHTVNIRLFPRADRLHHQPRRRRACCSSTTRWSRSSSRSRSSWRRCARSS